MLRFAPRNENPMKAHWFALALWIGPHPGIAQETYTVPQVAEPAAK